MQRHRVIEECKITGISRPLPPRLARGSLENTEKTGKNLLRVWIAYQHPHGGQSRCHGIGTRGEILESRTSKLILVLQELPTMLLCDPPLRTILPKSDLIITSPRIYSEPTEMLN